MNKLRGMHLFTRLATLGSFAAVGEEMGASASMVSKEIQKLEQDIGARLLHRTTRNLQLTDIGEGYLQRCREVLVQVEDAEAYVRHRQNSVQGKLRINVPMALGLTDLGKVLSDYMKAFPEVELDVHLGDESLDLLEHGFDLGFRASSLPVESNYIGRPLKAFDYHICASPDYLSRHTPITKPDDLKAHDCFVYSYFRRGNEWPVGEGVRIKGRLRVNNTLFMRDAVEAGLGIGFMPSFVALPGLRDGRLQEMLQSYSKPKLTLYSLYPNRKYTPPILAKCIEFLQAWFSDPQGKSGTI